MNTSNPLLLADLQLYRHSRDIMKNELAGLYIPPDPDPNTVYRTGSTVQRVTDTGKFLYVEDPQLGPLMLGDDKTPYGRLVYDLFTTPGMIRSMGVSQLCKDEASATIPNTAQFTRHSGLVALAHIVDNFALRYKIPDQKKIKLLLDLALDDSGHTFYSHATELDRQGWGGPENNHQKFWPLYAEFGGTKEVLRKHNVRFPENMQMSNLPLWATASAPDIDPDRWQYAPAESALWLDTDSAPAELREKLRKTYAVETIAIDGEGNLAFKDAEVALMYSKLYLLDSTEDWNDPINRIQLFLTVQAAKRLIVKRQFPWMDEVDKGVTRNPDWYLYGVDQDVVDALRENHGHTDPTLYAIHGVQNPIASAERKRFDRYKRHEYAAFLLDDKARDYPSEHLSPKRVEFGIPHPSVAITMEPSTAEERALNQKMPLLTHNNGSIEYTLMPLKNRFVDPRIIMKDGTSKRVSETYPQYAELLKQHRTLQMMKTKVELVFTKSYREEFIAVLAQNDKDFRSLMHAEDFTHDQKRKIIELAAARAKKAAIATGRYVLA